MSSESRRLRRCYSEHYQPVSDRCTQIALWLAGFVVLCLIGVVIASLGVS